MLAGHSRKHSTTSTSSLSEDGGPESKRRRISSSSLSDQGDSSDEDKPLASRGTTGAKTRPDGSIPQPISGKKKTSGLGVAHIVPRDGSGSAPGGLKIKIEQDAKLDSGQLDRLTSGVTVDVTSATEEVSSGVLLATSRLQLSFTFIL